MIDQTKINSIDHGRRAVLAWETIAETLNAKRMQVCAQITTAYRDRKSPREVYDLVATLNAIDELERTLKQSIDRGARAGKEILNGKPESYSS